MPIHPHKLQHGLGALCRLWKQSATVPGCRLTSQTSFPLSTSSRASTMGGLGGVMSIAGILSGSCQPLATYLLSSYCLSAISLPANSHPLAGQPPSASQPSSHQPVAILTARAILPARAIQQARAALPACCHPASLVPSCRPAAILLACCHPASHLPSCRPAGWLDGSAG